MCDVQCFTIFQVLFLGEIILIEDGVDVNPARCMGSTLQNKTRDLYFHKYNFCTRFTYKLEKITAK